MRVSSYKSRSCISNPSELPSNTASRASQVRARTQRALGSETQPESRVLYISVRRDALMCDRRSDSGSAA